MKILFCTDGSKISFNAIKNFSGWVNDAIVDAICVVDWGFMNEGLSLDDNSFVYSCSNIAKRILDESENQIKNLGLKFGQKINHCGSAIESILEQAEKDDYDLILMGSHGKKGLQKWLGSVSQEIINSSNISNYIAKKENNKKKLLITTDGTKCSTEIIRKIITSLKLEDKEIYICMVNEDPNLLFLEGTLDTNWLLDIQKQQQMIASHAVQDIQTILSEFNVQVTQTTILTGIPAQKIINFTKEQEIDLIIMGSRNKSRLDKFLTGSVSKRVLENVNADIWLARCNYKI